MAGGADFKREFGTLVEVHRAGRPAVDSRRPLYPRAAAAVGRRCRRRAGRDDAAAGRAGCNRLGSSSARRYIAAHRALDELETAALMPGPTG